GVDLEQVSRSYDSRVRERQVRRRLGLAERFYTDQLTQLPPEGADADEGVCDAAFAPLVHGRHIHGDAANTRYRVQRPRGARGSLLCPKVRPLTSGERPGRER